MFNYRLFALRKKLIILLVIAFSFFGVSSGIAQNCSADLVVEKNRNVRSADEDGTTFMLILTNTSSQNTSYTISTVNLKESCDTNNRRTSLSNVDLDIDIQDNMSRSLFGNSITINAGQSYKFMVHVEVPKGTSFNRWSCIEVQAKSEFCSTISAETTLRVFVPDPTEE